MADSKGRARKAQGEPGTSYAKWASAQKIYGDTLKQHRRQHEGVFHWSNLENSEHRNA